MWLQILLIFITTSSFAQKCTLDSPYAMCINEGWTQIPTGDQDSVVILNLSDNNIQNIKDGDLDRFERLHSLCIDNCKLETVGRMAFKHLRQLSYLDLSHNRLTRIDNDIFQYNTKLVDLVLSGNPLQNSKFPPILISESIRSLKMRNCGLREISSFMFSKLEKLRQLDLSKNNILTISDSAFNRNHLEEVCVDPEVFSVPVLSKIRSKTVTVNFTSYNAAENVCEFPNVRVTPDIKKGTTTVSTTSVETIQPLYPVLEKYKPTNEENSDANTPQTSHVTKSIYKMAVWDQLEAEPEKVENFWPQISDSATFEKEMEKDVDVITHENQSDQSEKVNNIFGASIGKGEMYTIMAVSMLVGAGLCYAVIQFCRKRRSRAPNRVSEPHPRIVGATPEPTPWIQPVVYQMVPQYELEYPNDMYERPRTPTGPGFMPPVHLSMPPKFPPLPPRPPSMSVASHHEYEYIQNGPTST